MSTVYYTASTLDGFIAGPGDDLTWLFQFGDPDPARYTAFEAAIGALAMGANTYRWVLGDLAARSPGGAPAWPYRQPTWVFTNRDLPKPPGADIRFARGDVRPVHAAMQAAAGERNVWLVGGGDLVGQFWDHGLLDELIVTLAPVTLGAGAPLLPRSITTPPLQLLSAERVSEDFVELRYAVRRQASPGR